MRRARSSSDFGINRTTSPIGGSGYPGEHVATREANIVPSESDSPSVKMRFFAWFSQAFKGPVVIASEAKQSNPYLNTGVDGLLRRKCSLAQTLRVCRRQ